MGECGKMNWAEIFKELIRFFPRIEIIDADEGGLFLRCGKLKKVIGAGVYFCWPYFDQISRYDSTTNTLKSTNQSITSKDKRGILVSWSVTYIIRDAEKALLFTGDMEEQIASSLSARIVDYIGKHDYADVKGHLLKNHLLNNEFLSEFREEWGIEIIGFYLHDLGLHRIFRLVSCKETE